MPMGLVANLLGNDGDRGCKGAAEWWPLGAGGNGPMDWGCMWVGCCSDHVIPVEKKTGRQKQWRSFHGGDHLEPASEKTTTKKDFESDEPHRKRLA